MPTRPFAILTTVLLAGFVLAQGKPNPPVPPFKIKVDNGRMIVTGNNIQVTADDIEIDTTKNTLTAIGRGDNAVVLTKLVGPKATQRINGERLTIDWITGKINGVNIRSISLDQ